MVKNFIESFQLNKMEMNSFLVSERNRTSNTEIMMIYAFKVFDIMFFQSSNALRIPNLSFDSSEELQGSFWEGFDE